MSNKNLTVVNTQDTKVALTRAKNLMGVANKLLAKSRAKELEAIKAKELANPLVWTDPDTNLTWQVDIDERKFTWKEAFDYAKELNENNFAGYNDWKVPTFEELRTLGNIKLYSFYDKSLNDFDSYEDWEKENWDKGYDNPKSHTGKIFIKKPLLNSMNIRYQWFWSSTTVASDTSDTWVVVFDDGSDYYVDKSDSRYVRCVRAKELETLKSKELANPLVWTDPDTNLTWQVDIDERKFTFDEAIDYAKELNENNFAGYNDWKVPTIEELKTILKKESYNNPKSYLGETFIKKPLLNSMTMRYPWFWSASPDLMGYSFAWYVNFKYGGSHSYRKTDKYYVRCARAGQ